MEDDTKVLTVFLLNVIGCILCCAALQGVIILSKRTNAELINLRKNYKNFIEFKKLSDLRRTFTRDQEILGNNKKEKLGLLERNEINENALENVGEKAED